MDANSYFVEERAEFATQIAIIFGNPHQKVKKLSETSYPQFY